MGALATRKPLLLFLLSGLLLFRFAERQLFVLLFHEPPRNTRYAVVGLTPIILGPAVGGGPSKRPAMTYALHARAHPPTIRPTSSARRATYSYCLVLMRRSSMHRRT